MSSSGADAPLVRFGSFALALDQASAFWIGAFARRFRSAPAPWPGVAPDTVLCFARAGHPPADTRGDTIVVERTASAARVQCDLMTLDMNWSSSPARATLTLHAPGWTDEALEHCVTVFVHKLLQLSDVVRLHGAAIDVDGRTQVLMGDKGSGKSTLTLALGLSGGRVLADDQIVVRRRAGALAVSGCDSNIRLTAETEHHLLPRPLDVVPQDFAGTLKKETSLEGLVAVVPYLDHPVSRIWFPRVGRQFQARSISGRDAAVRILNAIAPSHSFAGPADRWHLVQLIGAFVDGAECLEVELSPRLDDLHHVVTLARS